MSPTFFSTDDGDIILRAKSDSNSLRDFRVHKFILSLASSVFRDMFTFPQPPDQTTNPEHQPPVIDLLESPEVLDNILRFIYPGIEPPQITEPPILTATLLAVDKYNISSMYPALSENLKTFLPIRSVWVYIIANRFGFPEVAKEAARVSSLQFLSGLTNREDLQHISSVDLLRLIEFLQTREYEGIHRIGCVLDPSHLEFFNTCSHNKGGAQNYYFHLQKVVEQAFVSDPCMGTKDLFAILDKVPDPPFGCEPELYPAEWYYDGGCDEAFACPLQPMVVRKSLSEAVCELHYNNSKILDKFFGSNSGSG